RGGSPSWDGGGAPGALSWRGCRGHRRAGRGRSQRERVGETAADSRAAGADADGAGPGDDGYVDPLVLLAGRDRRRDEGRVGGDGGGRRNLELRDHVADAERIGSAVGESRRESHGVVSRRELRVAV